MNNSFFFFFSIRANSSINESMHDSMHDLMNDLVNGLMGDLINTIQLFENEFKKSWCYVFDISYKTFLTQKN